MASNFNFNFTQQQLSQILPNNAYTEHWFEALCKILPDYDITSVERVAAFVAQCAHESAGFTAIKENLNYRPESLRKLFPSHFESDAIAQQYAHNAQAIANRMYANRMGNGDEASGDGFRFCGRGLIQLTGRANYTAFAASIETDLDEVPAYLGTFEGAVQSACWFWETNNLNKFADSGDIKGMTRVINGGYLGLEERTKLYAQVGQLLQG